MTNEPITNAQTRAAVTDLGQMIGLCVCLTKSMTELEYGQAARIALSGPRPGDFFDGVPTQGDMRKYASRVLAFCIEILEGKVQ